MKMKKTIAMIMAMTMITGAFAACGEKEEGTPHTTYSVDEINNMSNDELEKALEQAAQEIEASEKAAEETAAAEAQVEEIDLWKDVEVTFSGAEGFMKVSVEYVGDNQIIKDNVALSANLDGMDEQVFTLDFITLFGYKNGGEYDVFAKYDEAALAEQGIVLKKNDPPKDSYYRKYYNDCCRYTVSGLGSSVEINEDTDLSVFAEVVDAVTERVKINAQNGEYGFEWAKDTEIIPDEFYMVKGFGSGDGYVHYVDKDGNECCWVHLSKLNFVNEDGTWIKEIWMENDPHMFCVGVIGLVDEAIIKVDF